MVDNNCQQCKTKFNACRLSKFCSKNCANKNWYIDNKNHRLNKNKVYRQNPETKAKLAKKVNDWFTKHPEKIKEYRAGSKEKAAKVRKQKYKEDVNFRILSILRNHHSRIRHQIKDPKVNFSTLKDLGCTIDEFKIHMESKFQPNMTWENWGRGLDKWHMDHIKPLSKFNLINPIEYEKACHYSNLQPLWEKQNLSKGSKYG